MRIVIAPSGFKENLDAENVASAIARGVLRACPDADVVELPLADGAEGTARTVALMTGRSVKNFWVTAPSATRSMPPSHFLATKSRLPSSRSRWLQG